MRGEREGKKGRGRDERKEGAGKQGKGMRGRRAEKGKGEARKEGESLLYYSPNECLAFAAKTTLIVIDWCETKKRVR